MTRECFNKQFAALVNAYTIARKISEEAQDVYWEMLRDIPDQIFHVGVVHCLATCKFFPTIAELGEASLPTKVDKSLPVNPHAERPMIDWREQARRIVEQEQRRLDQKKTLT